MKKIVAAIVAVAVIVFVGYLNRDQYEARTNCAGKIAHQFATSQVVGGAWDCLAPDTKEALSVEVGIDTPTKFARLVGLDGVTYTYLGKTNAGGYTFRFDYPALAHNSVKQAWQDLVSGKVQDIWPELNGETQGWYSFVKTFYLYPKGSILENIKTGQVFDISGDLESIY